MSGNRILTPTDLICVIFIGLPQFLLATNNLGDKVL